MFIAEVPFLKVLEAARRGYRAHGIELNLWLVLYSRVKARTLGLSGAASFARQDLWKSDLSKYDNVVIFGVEQMVIKTILVVASKRSNSISNSFSDAGS